MTHANSQRKRTSSKAGFVFHCLLTSTAPVKAFRVHSFMQVLETSLWSACQLPLESKKLGFRYVLAPENESDLLVKLPLLFIISMEGILMDFRLPEKSWQLWMNDVGCLIFRRYQAHWKPTILRPSMILLRLSCQLRRQ
jgi:hypothetical protein